MGLGQWEKETSKPRVTGFDRKQQESFASVIPWEFLAQCHVL